MIPIRIGNNFGKHIKWQYKGETNAREWSYVEVYVLFYIKSKDTTTVRHEKFLTA